MHRPARSQSPKRVGSGPFGPPISRRWSALARRSSCRESLLAVRSTACDSAVGGVSPLSFRSCSRTSGMGKVCQIRLGHALRRPGVILRPHWQNRRLRERRTDTMDPRYCLLPSYGCIEVRGVDTATFLNGQLSRSLGALDETLAPLAGWHDPRGRVRALLRVVRRPDRWWLVTDASVAATTAKRLAMFVLRA